MNIVILKNRILILIFKFASYLREKKQLKIMTKL